MRNGNNAGRRGGQWRKLTAQLRAEHRPCWLCHQRIDYQLTWPHPQSFSTDHRRPLSQYPKGAQDPANLEAAHLECNVSRGDREPPRQLGAASRTW